jgi:hypothetical protein
VFGGRIKLDKHLLERAKAAAEQAGYGSVEEFIIHAVEKELAQLEAAAPQSPQTDQAVLDRLKGLGYIE